VVPIRPGPPYRRQQAERREPPDIKVGRAGDPVSSEVRAIKINEGAERQISGTHVHLSQQRGRTRPGADIPAGDPWVLRPSASILLADVMSDTVAALAGPLTVPVQRMVGAGGKRLRPALTMAVAALWGPSCGSDALTLAAAVELMHCATLVHDDLIDGAQLRRGVPAISAREGVPAAVVSGDLLIAAASVLACGVSQSAGMVLAATLADLCRGEALEELLRYDPAASIGQLTDVVAAKTGALIRAACLLGALCGGPGPAPAVAEFGLQFGISLQLVDDVLDVVSSPALLGKPAGADFAAGIMTLPAAFALRAHPELRGLLRPDLSPADRDSALAMLRTRTAIGPAVAAALGHARAAQAALLTVTGADRGVEDLAQWPERYLQAQLAAKTDPRWAQLVAAGAA